MADRPAHDSMVICHAICLGHAEQVGGSLANGERFFGAQRRRFRRIIS